MKGMTVLELIITLGIVAIGLVGILALDQFTLSGSAISQSRLIAANLAQEGIELVRSIRDTNWLEGSVWDEGLTNCNNCGMDYDEFSLDASLDYLNTPLRIDGNGFYNYDSGQPTIFSRSLDIENKGNMIVITCTVKWEEHNRLHTLSVQGEIYNWQ